MSKQSVVIIWFNREDCASIKKTFKNSNIVLEKKKKKKKNVLKHLNFDTTFKCCNVVMLYQCCFYPNRFFYRQQTVFIKLFQKKAKITILFLLKNPRNNNIILVISI
jgi:hypothetical protein